MALWGHFLSSAGMFFSLSLSLSLSVPLRPWGLHSSASIFSLSLPLSCPLEVGANGFWLEADSSLARDSTAIRPRRTRSRLRALPSA